MRKQNLTEIVKDFLFPRRCPVCDKPVRFGKEKICDECFESLQFVTAPWCMKCGKKLLLEKNYCKDCREREHVFDRGRAVFQYESVKRSLYAFKYGGRQEYGAFFGETAARLLRDFLENINPDALVPIPLSRQRMRRRGYNQAGVLAEEIGKQTGIPVFHDLLLRVKNTSPLKTQNLVQRQNNLKKAFIIGRNDVKLKTIIIIDDIYTTGSTIDEAARTLKEWGAEKVVFLVMACGVGM